MSAICGIVGEGVAAGKGRRDVGLMLDLLKPRGPDGALVHEHSAGGRPFVFGARQLAVVVRHDDAREAHPAGTSWPARARRFPRLRRATAV